MRGSDNNVLPGTDNASRSSRLDGYNRSVSLRPRAKVLSLIDQIFCAQRQGVSAYWLPLLFLGA